MPKYLLDRLEKVDLRRVWTSESRDFTPWLSQESNLAILGEVLDLDLELEAQEKNIGPFRADILCKDTITNQWVLIENQIERTDHCHLGQLLTYAAGLRAVTIVWISSEFTEEHRAALDWLNEVTTDGINFFGLQIELWKIGDSNPAPRFNVVSKPNEWTHTVSQATRNIGAGNLTETKKLQLEYWISFNKLLKERNTSIHALKPAPQHWMYYAVGRSDFTLMTFLNIREKRVGVGLVISGQNAKSFYKLLELEREAIESEFGKKLDWRELPTKAESHILLNNFGCDLAEQKRWPEYQIWMFEHLEKLKKVLANRIRNLDLDDYVPVESEPGNYPAEPIHELPQQTDLPQK
ncbi:MAG TPA: DUF4268 domain-containing protein [Anaerolineales bacterium]